ncbi:TRAP transporter small permease [Larsenimonas rhizosphaerae]|uniref:TRAP transporter small permease protein n=1 Tax=Larsenimonas rhizosphaerae TaxID=2944682 RepID=A0AA41ZFX2_9GAMM|nr:TRAP transporter small permease [Larsenimonas rhizosphaerae]MCM2131105.1 TRAP transporter small permease [Larsenimonas rhizosphaerae]MCX2523810.1 TRAP transporter small permease [Larsenimonas rhizosphaerae]
MRGLVRLWNNLEEGLVAFLLAAMTLVTFTYVMANNLYAVFYAAADAMPSMEDFWFAIGDYLLEMAQEMTWSSALTKAMFGWLIFLGISYGVRVGAHIGVDLLTRTFPMPLRKLCGILVILIAMGYALLFMISSYDWVMALFNAQLGAEDLDEFHVMQWHIALIVPVGFGLVLLRLVEALINVARGRQIGLEMGDEAADAMKLMNKDDAAEENRP